MNSRIPQNFLDDIIARTDIVETISNRVHLKKAGKDFTACCPFHEEKTPSFTVSPSKQFYHCFGCSAHGNVINFIMQYDKLPFAEAVEMLANLHGLTLPQTESGNNTPQAPSNNHLYSLMGKVASFFHQQIGQADLVQTYLKKRKLSAEVIETFNIGYAPNAWGQLLNRFRQNSADLQLTGMCLKSQHGKIYDRFRNRLMFPLRDVRGRVIAFGGRALVETDTPKYLNSPETPIFHKSQALYGLYEACQANKKLESLIVVEGYLDVISLFQHGFTATVATMGTAITQQHLQQLLRYCQQIIFCFDGDKAGYKAAQKAMNISLPIMRDGVSMHFLLLPEGQDPDSFIQNQGSAAFQSYLDKAMSLEDFFFHNITQQADSRTIEGKSKIASIAKSMLNQVPHGVYKHLLNNRLEKLLGVKLTNLTKPASTPKRSQPTKRSRLSPALLAIALLLQNPKLAALVPDVSSFETFPDEGIPLLLRLIKHLQQHPDHQLGILLEHWRDQEGYETLCQLATVEHVLNLEASTAEFQGSLLRLKKSFHEQKIHTLMQRASQQPLSEQEKQLLLQLIADK